MDISVIFKLAAIGIIVTIICQILKKSDRDDMAMVVGLIGLIIGLSVVISMISDFFTQIKQLFDIF
ncbi:MAG: stage III sporulation protein AC [Candidatus Coproplasma sp.]